MCAIVWLWIQVIVPRVDAAPELELYPIQVQLFRNQVSNVQRPQNNANMFAGIAGNLGGMVYSKLHCWFVSLFQISFVC